MLTRQSVNNLSEDQKNAYVRGVKALKQSGRYNWFVNTHMATMTHGVAHQDPTFLPWHRQFLLDFENAMQQALDDPNFALPYWDWANDATLPNSAWGYVWAGLMGLDGNPVTSEPFAEGEWTLADGTALVRAFGKAVPTLPTQADVDNALSISTYDTAPWDTTSRGSFRNTLEGWVNGPALHNRVHLWVGGSMLPMTSPNDPVFFLHHCNVDRIWALWQKKYQNSSYLPVTGASGVHGFNDAMWPWMSPESTPALVWDCQRLGYQYGAALGEQADQTPSEVAA